MWQHCRKFFELLTFPGDLGVQSAETPIAMDTDYCNGQSFNDVLVPEEIITHILSYVDVPHLPRCRLVCKRWNEIIKSQSLWFLLYNRKYHTIPRPLPWYLFYHLFAKTNFFDSNLLKNVNGEEKFAHWKITTNGGDCFRVEKPPSGSEPLPCNVDEFNNNTGCFATSYRLCSKTQVICFKECELEILRKFKPHIYVSEWVAPRFDCGCQYVAELVIARKNGKRTVGGRLEYREEQWTEAKWTKLEMIVKDYPNDIQHIEFEHRGQDTQFWKGHYGVKMAGAVVKILHDSIKPTSCI